MRTLLVSMFVLALFTGCETTAQTTTKKTDDGQGNTTTTTGFTGKTDLPVENLLPVPVSPEKLQELREQNKLYREQAEEELKKLQEKEGESV
ncbi:MAG: hypothetical protein ACYSWY_05385 [Planctomycetota bacterium]